MSSLAEQFRVPGAEYSLMPFWFLNDRLDRGELLRQMDDFRQKGIDGFVLHPRMGLPDDYEYLGEPFMSDVRFLVTEAHRRGMKVVLYDEGMYPSGSAHGLVVAGNPEFAARALRLESIPASRPALPELREGERVEAAFLQKSDSVSEIALSAPLPAGEGSLLFLVSTFSRGTIRGIHFGEDDGEDGAPPAADLLNPDAVRKFLRVTYDRYYEAVGDYFGTTVIAMFTDEPSLLGRCTDGNALKPWTEGFLPFYEGLGNRKEDLLALWGDGSEEDHFRRCRYEKAVETRLEQTYYRQLSQWCASHGIALTGHPAKSCDIGAEQYFQIPGQDVVWRSIHPGRGGGVDGPDSVLGKCSADSARCRGRRRNSDECFGCCGPDGRQWEFTADDMKWYMDWLFARGVNLLYPHAFLYSARGEKRLNERAPDVGPNNLWWKHYTVFSGYAKRMCWLNTDSSSHASVAVLCTADAMPWRIAKPLWQNQYEFTYLEETLLGTSRTLEKDGLLLGGQCFRAAVVEEPQRLSTEARRVLTEFSRAGGLLILWGGDLPEAANAVRISRPEELPAALERVVPKAVELPGFPDLRAARLTKSGEEFFLLVNEGEEPIRGKALFPASGYPELWDAMNGNISPLAFSEEKGGLRVPVSLPRRSSAIVHISREKPAENPPEAYRLLRAMELSGCWALNIDGKEIPLAGLRSWTECSSLQNYSGEGAYTLKTDIAVPENAKKVILRLGTVRGTAEIAVNGSRAGVKLWAPFCFDITQQAGRRITDVKITVTNSIANRLTGAALPSGLLGPVSVRLYG